MLRTSPVLFTAALISAGLSLYGGEALDWPQFRGPGGQGHAPGARDLPVVWSPSRNIAWRAEVPGRGWSSPVVRAGKVWLTTALRDGRSLRALAYDRESGRRLADVEVFAPRDPGRIHPKNSYASPTPILEEGRVYVHFGANGTAALDESGRILWATRIEYSHGHGPGGSPVLWGDLLIMSCDGTDRQFVVALDKRTGEERWRTPRPGRMAYSTPLAIRVGGRDMVVSTGGGRAVAYDPATGKELWWCRYDGYSLVPRPVYAEGLVFIATGYDTPWLYAVRPDGTGDITATHVVWKRRRGAPNNPSPIAIEGRLYVVSDSGILTVLEAKTGKEYGRMRLGGRYSASPAYADGKLYFLNEEAVTTVLRPGKRLEVIARNELPGRALASIAVSGRALFLRTDEALYRIEKKPAAEKGRAAGIGEGS